MSNHPKEPPRWQNSYGLHYHTAETHDLNAGDFRQRMHAYGLTVERKPLTGTGYLREIVAMRYELDTTTDGPF